MADTDESCITFDEENIKLPSHIVVQKQLHDIIAIQKARAARLEESVS